MAALPPILHKPAESLVGHARAAAREGYLLGLSFLFRQRVPNAIPQFSPNFQDHRLPIVFLVPGYLENHGCFSTLYEELLWSGVRLALYKPRYTLASVREMASDFATFMNLTLSREECENSPVFLVGHSMGGLICRQAMLKHWQMRQQVQHLFTLATPHQGTHMAHLGLGDCVVDMLPGSRFLSELNKADRAYRHKMTSVIATPDALLLRTKAAKLDGARHTLLERSGHMALLDDARLFNHLKAEIYPHLGA